MVATRAITIWATVPILIDAWRVSTSSAAGSTRSAGSTGWSPDVWFGRSFAAGSLEISVFTREWSFRLWGGKTGSNHTGLSLGRRVIHLTKPQSADGQACDAIAVGFHIPTP